MSCAAAPAPSPTCTWCAGRAARRLLHAISITQRHLRFWQARLRAGSHGSFLLLGRGPAGFASDVLERLGVAQQQRGGISASDRIQERVGVVEAPGPLLAVRARRLTVRAYCCQPQDTPAPLRGPGLLQPGSLQFAAACQPMQRVDVCHAARCCDACIPCSPPCRSLHCSCCPPSWRRRSQLCTRQQVGSSCCADPRLGS